MRKKNSAFRENFKKYILKNKTFLTLQFLLLSLLCGYLLHNNNTLRKSTQNDTSVAEKLKPETDFNTQRYYNINNKNNTNNINSFNETNLINDNRGVPVLYYHSVRESADNEVTITPESLREQLKYIKDQGYITLTISQLENYILNNSPIPQKSIAITFDDGYMDNYYNAFPILKNLNMVATIFCITSNLDGSYYLSKDAIIEMSNYGIDIQSHTVTHPKLSELTYSQQLIELKESKKTLESILEKKIDSIAYPYGDFNDDSIKAAKDAGYTLAFTTKRGLSDRNDNPLKLDRIYISSKYSLDTFKEILSKTEK